MAFTPNTQCLICQLVKGGDRALFRRINESSQFVPGGPALTSISRDYEGKFAYPSLFNHVKKHQAPSRNTLKKKRAQAETKAAYKDLQVATKGHEVKTVEKAEEAMRAKVSALAPYDGNQTATRGQLIDRLLGMAMDGQIKWNGGNLVSLLAQEQKAEEAQKDRQFEMEKMVYHFIAQGGTPADYLKYNEDEVTEGEVVA